MWQTLENVSSEGWASIARSHSKGDLHLQEKKEETNRMQQDQESKQAMAEFQRFSL